MQEQHRASGLDAGNKPALQGDTIRRNQFHVFIIEPGLARRGNHFAPDLGVINHVRLGKIQHNPASPA